MMGVHSREAAGAAEPAQKISASFAGQSISDALAGLAKQVSPDAQQNPTPASFARSNAQCIDAPSGGAGRSWQ
jgi:hypothetical protein